MADFPFELQRTAIYLRKSRADMEAEARGEGETLARHKKALIDLAHRNKLKVISIKEEIASGERIVDRPEMKDLLDEVEARTYEAVLCMDLDRLGRGDMIDQGRILAAFKNSSTLIITPRKAYNLADELDEEWGEIEAFFARRELKIITKRLQRGRIMAVQEGKFIGSHSPYGYDKGPDQILIPNKSAEIVRLIFNCYVYGINGEQLGSTKIARRLNQMGIKSPIKNGLWEPSAVLSILKNEVYIGKVQWKKSFRDKNKKSCRRLPREVWIEAQGKHEPLIKESLFAAAQEIMKKRRIAPTGKEPQNPLAGIIICGKCGRKMVMQRGRAGRVAMLKCINPACKNKASSFHYVEERLLTALREELADFEITGENIEEELQIPPTPPLSCGYLEELEKQLAGLRKQRSRVQELLEQEIYNIPIYYKRQGLVDEKINKTKQLIANTKKEIALYEEKQPCPNFPMIKHILDAYCLTNQVIKKNLLLKSIIEEVIYTKEKSEKKDQFSLEVLLLI